MDSLSDIMSGGPTSQPPRMPQGDHHWSPTKADSKDFQKTVMRVIVKLGSGFVRWTLETRWCGEF